MKILTLNKGVDNSVACCANIDEVKCLRYIYTMRNYTKRDTLDKALIIEYDVVH